MLIPKTAVYLIPLQIEGPSLFQDCLLHKAVSRLAVLAYPGPVKANISRKQIILQVVIKILNGSQLCAFG